MMCSIVRADVIDFFASKPADHYDLIFGSSPYADARTYGIDAVRQCQEWVDWMLAVSEAALPTCKGLIAWVVAGVQHDCNYWPGPEGLVWEWYKRGHYQWVPCVWWKVDETENGTAQPGSGGSQGLRKDWEYVLMFRRDKKLAFADNTAMGHKPIYDRVGGSMSNRHVDGRRINERVGHTKRKSNGKMERQSYKAPPDLTNPGNVIPIVVKARVGGGHIGSRLAHSGEAPFPEKLASFFVRSYSPPGGRVCDPFSGSGTTASVCKEFGRDFDGCDIRQSQVDLGLRRVSGQTPNMFV